MSSSVAEPVAVRAKKKQPSIITRALQVLASLRLTVVLFSFSLFLVLVGTLAQVDDGIWTVVDKYFRSDFVLVPFQLFFPRSMKVPGVFPFFGGWLIGTALLVNLVAAHLVRFRLAWKRSGILLIHSGIVVLLLSELIAGMYQVEARMTIAEGETVNFIELSRKTELAFTDTSNPDYDSVVAIPGSKLVEKMTVRDDQLPVDVEIVEVMPNTDLVELSGTPKSRDIVTNTLGDPYEMIAVKTGKGVDTNQREDAPAVRVVLHRKGTGEVLDTKLLSLWFSPNFTLRTRTLQFPPQTVTVDGKTYTIELRSKRVQKPYSLKLYEFRHDIYLGTDTPKNYSSLVRLNDPERNEDREVLISMNAPLRVYDGDPLLRKCDTLYQSGYLPVAQAGIRGTVLQVVRNPGWLMPYIACFLVTLGMLFHFGLTLIQFLGRRVAK